MYVVDLIGLPATANGVEVGRVVGVENFGAGDLVEIEAPDGARRLIPFARCDTSPVGLAIDPAFLT
jgi:16S rRNA processing protein RimM